jgi:2-iminoacetate synthase
MSNFLDAFSEISPEEIQKKLSNTDASVVADAISKETPNYDDFLYMLSKGAEPLLDKMALISADKTQKHFGKNIQFYIPMYVSNECSNACIYCGFNKNNDIPRKTLSLQETEKEFKALKKPGFENILILTGESPENADVDYIAEVVKIARKYFSFVSLEIYPMDEKDYKKLVDAGAVGLTIYQETYNRKTYDKVHVSGEKKDFNYRIQTPDRALAAGFRKIGIGALLGLSDWRADAAFLGAHAQYLMKKYWRSEVSISFPRLRGSSSGFKPFFEVQDKELVQMILALRIFLYNAGITLSTREPSEFRDNMIGLGVTMMSAGSKTNPGGYETCGNDSEKQFEISDSRSVEDVVKVVRAKGHYPVFKDWDNVFEGVKK